MVIYIYIKKINKYKQNKYFMTIKHLVINGGGPNMWYMYGALKHLSDEKFWSIKDIENIYATSAGALLLTVILLIKDWQKIDNFVINCTWNKYIDISIDRFFILLKKKGMYDIKLYQQILKPLLEMNNMTLDTTMKEFYEFSNVNTYFFSSNLDRFTYVSISNISHPDLPLITALQMTSAVPPIVEPVNYNDETYFDGALFYNYPLKPCVDNKNINADEILALKNMENSTTVNSLTQQDTFFDYISIMLKKFIMKSDNMCIQPKIKHELHLMFKSTIDYDYWIKILSDKTYRESIKQDGIKCAKLFLLYH